MSNYQLAQINIARARDELDSIRMRGFVARLDEINALADRSDGFIWRFQSAGGEITASHLFDPSVVINMSVWASIEALKGFVYKSAHVELISMRQRWFEKPDQAHQALWWIPERRYPTIEQGAEKLMLLEQNGPGSDAFTFARPFPKPASG